MAAWGTPYPVWCTNLAPRGDVGKGGPATPGFPAWGGLGVTRTGWAACGPTSGVEILICSFARERAVARAGEPVQLPASGRVAGLGPIARGRVHLTDQPRDGSPHELGWFTDEPAGHRVNRALPGSGPARAGRRGQALESANAGQGGGVGRGEQPDNPFGKAKTPAHRRGFPFCTLCSRRFAQVFYSELSWLN